MKFTRCAIVGLSLIGLLSGCSETETTLSVNVRYWTNYLNPESFKVKIEQEGRTAIEEAIVPRDLGDGKFDVVCDHNWEIEYCRFYKRFELAGWSETDVTVTLSGETVDGKDIATDIAERSIGDNLSDTFELQSNEVNVVYIQLANVKAPADPVSPDMTSDDSSGSSAADSGVNDGGTSTDESTDSGSTEAGVADGSVPDAGADAGDAGDAAGGDSSMLDGGSSDGGASDGSVVDAAMDAGDAN